MEILRTVKDIKAFSKKLKQEGKTIGLVPTMGALHAGHLSLVGQARKQCDAVIVSVFVNPVQFGPNEDYNAYPRCFEQDCDKLRVAGVDAVFHPEPREMYPQGYCTYVNVEGDITHKLCGAQRPGHFRGVATVVTKLINLARADKAFFGQKDAQQVVVVRRFTEDLNIPCEIIMVPIVREESGLARSSRNRYLSVEEKQAACVLSQSLRLSQTAYEKGNHNADALKDIVIQNIQKEPLADIDYVSLYTYPELEPVQSVDEPCLLAIAVRVGKTRLIDNIILGGAQ